MSRDGGIAINLGKEDRQREVKKTKHRKGLGKDKLESMVHVVKIDLCHKVSH